MRNSKLLAAAAMTCCAITCGAILSIGNAAIAKDDSNACMEGPMAQFGRYVGDWKIEDESLAKDGSGWGPGQGARWVFECIGEGTAVQDFWYPNSGGYGTNLRTYNPDTRSWEIVWSARTQNGLMYISAKQDDEGKILMDILRPVQEPPRRITFLPPHDNGWDWVMETSFDEGETWTAVYKIKATPWQETSN